MLSNRIAVEVKLVAHPVGDAHAMRNEMGRAEKMACHAV
jgi:hypothetical protein